MKIRALIVDDEPLARMRVRQLLADDNEIEIIGECGNGRQAVAAIQQHRPDLVFLDVQMPRMNGIDVCRALTERPLPLVIFVTAYDQFALQAFEVHAIDYLLKPFDGERFKKAVAHAKEQLVGGTTASLKERLEALLQEFRTETRKADRFAFRSEGRVVFVHSDEIDWIESEGNYVRLHAGERTHLMREPISAMERLLPPAKFLRISRSVIVNLNRVKEVQPLFYGDHVVILRNGTKLTLTRSHRDKLDALVMRPH
jgi:two-component system LytT family response regulator